MASAALALTACGSSATVDNAALVRAIDDHRAVEVTVSATVMTLLTDSSGADGAHQRFQVSIDGRGVEVDHNVSLAPRVPVSAGGTLTIHGQFEPDPGHPVIHFTHHTTGGHEGGWIDYGGKRYE